MRTEHLIYFLSLVETNSITQTGKQLYTTHQNVSRIIRQLEADLDSLLFVRTVKGVSLTPTGKLLLPLAKRTVADFTQLRTDIRTLKTRTNISGSLQIFSSEVSTITVLSSLIQIFSDFYPSVEIRLQSDAPLGILRHVALHPTMIGIAPVFCNPEFECFFMPYLQQVEKYPLLQDTYQAVLTMASPLATLKSVPLAKFVQEPVATLLSGNNEEEDLLTQIIHSRQGKVAFSSTHIQTYLGALLSGRYVGITSRMGHQKLLERNLSDGQLIVLPFQEDLQFQVSLLVHQNAQLNEASQVFVDFMRHSYLYL